MGLTRREFLRASAGITALIALPPIVFGTAEKERVGARYLKSYDIEDGKAIRRMDLFIPDTGDQYSVAWEEPPKTMSAKDYFERYEKSSISVLSQKSKQPVRVERILHKFVKQGSMCEQELVAVLRSNNRGFVFV